MTLHYLSEDRVRDWYAEARHLLTSDGLLLVADAVRDAPVPAKPQSGGTDSWTAWWTTLAEEPSITPLLGERTAALYGLRSAEFRAPADWHGEAARRAGFTDATVPYQYAGHALMAFRR